MGKQYSWAEVRERAAAELGGYPDAKLEQEILEVFRERPAFVVAALADVKRAYEAGRIHSPWPFLRKQLTSSAADEIVTDESERERLLARARTWMRTIGLLYDRWSECEQVLFAPQVLTAPLEQLEALERSSRDAPGRGYYGALLKASIARTASNGAEPVPNTPGLLERFASDELRAEMKALYERLRPLVRELELAQERRFQWRAGQVENDEEAAA